MEIITADKTNGIAGKAIIWTIATPRSLKTEEAPGGINRPNIIEKGSM
tara:strand:+ start:310 stop:453 length:144 start_codon:yes stop_codon:yes gene_type:complete